MTQDIKETLYTENTPLVSILLLSMNHESYIEQCILSIINQTYKNIEILYLDNASSDNTYNVGEKLLKESGIAYKTFFNCQSKSISANANFLFDKSSGSFISPISADDWFDPKNIETKINHYLSNPDIGALFSNGWIYNQFEKTLFLNDASSFKRGQLYKEVLTEPDCMFYVGVIYKREIIEKVGKWDETLIIEDTDMFIRISLISNIDYINEPLVYYRRLSSSVSKNKNLMLEGFQQYYLKYKNVKWINMRVWLSSKYRSMAASCVDEGKLTEAGNFLSRAITINPIGIQNFRTLIYLLKKSFK